jgi:hypothetical protein
MIKISSNYYIVIMIKNTSSIRILNTNSFRLGNLFRIIHLNMDVLLFLKLRFYLARKLKD